jgi:hypothetical protein
MNIRIITLIALLSLVGCQDRFRYPCQDPSNWNDAQCKKPECEATRTCPDLIIKPDKRMSTPVSTPVEKKIEKKGDCK